MWDLRLGRGWKPMANYIKSNFRLLWSFTKPGCRITMFWRKHAFNFTKYCQIALPNSYTNLYSHLYCMSSYFHTFLATSGVCRLYFYQSDGCEGMSHFDFNLHFSTIEHLFMCLLVIWISSSVNWLFISFAFKKNLGSSFWYKRILDIF